MYLSKMAMIIHYGALCLFDIWIFLVVFYIIAEAVTHDRIYSIIEHLLIAIVMAASCHVYFKCLYMYER